MIASAKTATCTLVLGLSLMGFAVPAEARKPKPPVTPPVTMLTAPEQLCVTWGALAFEQAQARDRGVSYFALVQIVRQSSLDPAVVQLGLGTLRVIYALPELTPASARQQAELVCAQRLEGTLVAQ
jgi:hypothetical protein